MHSLVYSCVCNNVSDTEEKQQPKKCPLMLPLPWKFGSQVDVLKSLLFPTHLSPLVTLWWPWRCRSSCSMCHIMCLLTFLSRWSEAEQLTEAASKQELRSSCETALLWVLKPGKFQGKCRSFQVWLLSEVVAVPVTEGILQACLGLMAVTSHLPWPLAEPGCLLRGCPCLIVGQTH